MTREQILEASKLAMNTREEDGVEASTFDFIGTNDGLIFAITCDCVEQF